MMSDLNLDQLISAWLDGRISQSDSELLQQELRDSVKSRERFREHTKLDASIREIALGDWDTGNWDTGNPDRQKKPSDSFERKPRALVATTWSQLAIATVLMLCVGAIAYQLGRHGLPTEIDQAPSTPSSLVQVDERSNEKTIAGHATLRRVAGIRWSEGSSAYRAGDVLTARILAFEEGVAEIDFFCGATVVIEGPAQLELESDWSMRLWNGRLRANVPPAARGFVVKAADAEIIDLGTEFVLEVGPENAQVEVVDGEIKLRGGKHDGSHLVTGQSEHLRGINRGEDSLKNLATIGDVKRRQESEQLERFMQWKAHSQELRVDSRLIAYYPIAETRLKRIIVNEAETKHASDGQLVGLVDQTAGRFGPESTGLEFNRLGARVRARVDGEFEAFTFACWVKIDSLEHVYNALFMADGYENGEPHWQIRNDGRLMFSVMVDDAKEVRVASRHDQTIVKDAGLHRVYFSEPIWNSSREGQWLHLAAVYDPVRRRVCQYVDGKQVSNEAIQDKFFVDTLRIGAGEIGNWGQPFRDTPWFAVRNLNGAIDEMAIFNASLSPEEIQALYEKGKPVGY